MRGRLDRTWVGTKVKKKQKRYSSALGTRARWRGSGGKLWVGGRGHRHASLEQRSQARAQWEIRLGKIIWHLACQGEFGFYPIGKWRMMEAFVLVRCLKNENGRFANLCVI